VTTRIHKSLQCLLTLVTSSTLALAGDHLSRLPACTSVGRTTNAKRCGYLRNAVSGRLFSHAVFPQVYALQQIAARLEFACHVH